MAQQEEKFFAYASFEKAGKFVEYEYVPRPLGEKDIEIHISHCGICYSDIHTNSEFWNPVRGRPFVGGHEIVGKVVAVGSAVQGFKVGDRVGVGAQSGSCMSFNDCNRCRYDNDNVCPKALYTYNSKLPDGSVTFGGYQNKTRVPSSHAFIIPENLPSDAAAPLMCAGITVWAPLRRLGAGATRKRVGVIGIGGLGHFALQFAAKLGCDVTAISTSDRKKEDAMALGATRFINSSNQEEMTKAANSLDLIINTVSDNINYDAMFTLIDLDGAFVQVGVPKTSISMHPGQVIFKRIIFTGSLIGSRKEIDEMLDFSAKNNIVSWINKLPMSRVNDGIQMVLDNQTRYRVVLENEKYTA